MWCLAQWKRNILKVSGDFPAAAPSRMIFPAVGMMIVFTTGWLLLLWLVLCGNGQKKCTWSLSCRLVLLPEFTQFDSLGHQISFLCISNINMHLMHAREYRGRILWRSLLLYVCHYHFQLSNSMLPHRAVTLLKCSFFFLVFFFNRSHFTWRNTFFI